jgi:adenine-specific DNA-methyltransferase
MDNFIDLSNQLNKILDKNTKKTNGIFFTPKEYRHKLLQSVKCSLDSSGFTPENVLEPSFGSGEFIEDIMELLPSLKITGVELNSLLFEKVSEKLHDENLELINMDFIKYNPKKSFDLIVGNPPYVVIKDTIPDEFKEISSGRPNLYCWFIHKCIRLLSEQGVLAFVIPNSILNTAYYEMLRKYIVDTCDIIDIISFDGKKSLFTDTDQATIGFILRKRPAEATPSKKYIIDHKTRLFFSSNYKFLLEKLVKYPCLKQLGVSVKTGTVVWNQHKEKLKANPTEGQLLIYSTNIKKGKFIPFIDNVSKNDKKQYIKIEKKELIKGPVILMNRGYGNTSYDPNIMFVEDTIPGHPDGFYVENHLNIIYPTTDETKGTIKRVYEYLTSEDNIAYIKMFTGNGAMSKTEIETLLPICLPDLTHN